MELDQKQNKIRVHGSMEMGLNACGSMLVAKIGACGLTGMGFDACGSVLVAKISACGLMEFLLVGFDYCGACGF
ncbi:hypothetical protein SO802_001894 [Lithocarpus litseifolius]|uniref:Uncharacterized protein n=1 Tax=Lithocarpus litseifolius TaxID=425828 RepID=A0AAW2DZQ2_9ROSI